MSALLDTAKKNEFAPGSDRLIQCPRCGEHNRWYCIGDTLKGVCPCCMDRLGGSLGLVAGLSETYFLRDDSFLCLRGC